MSYKIVADSAANLYHLQGVPFAYVPLKVVCGETEYVDTPELDLEGMLEDLKTTKLRSGTSCPNTVEWQQAFEGADEVFAVTITGRLSGSYSAAEKAREAFVADHPAVKVHVFDTLSAGPEMHLIVEKIAALKQAGRSFEEVIAEVEAYSRHTHLIFCLKSLNNLARNGRVGAATAALVGLLGIRVVGRATKGVLDPFAKSRGAEKSLQTIFGEMRSRGFAGGRVRITHCRNEAGANALRERILAAYPTADVAVASCTALCSFYAEIGGLMIGYESE